MNCLINKRVLYIIYDHNEDVVFINNNNIKKKRLRVRDLLFD